MTVVEDLKVSLGESDNSATARRENGPSSMADRASLIGAGITLKGRDKFDDEDCDGVYNPISGDVFVPFDPEYDLDMDGAFDPGTVIDFWDESSGDVQFVIESARAEVDLSAAFVFSFRVAEVGFSCNLPDDRVFHLDGGIGAEIGDFLNIDLASGTLDLDFDSHEYSGQWTMSHKIIPSFVITGQFVMSLPAQTFQMNMDNDISLGWIDIGSAGGTMSFVDGKLGFSSVQSWAGVASAQSDFVLEAEVISGSATQSLEWDGFQIAAGIEFQINENHCFSGTGTPEICLTEDMCVAPTVQLHYCNPGKFGLGTADGDWFGLGCPANLHLYDSQGRHVGLSGDDIELGIPGAFFGTLEDTAFQYAFIPDGAPAGSVRIEVEGLDSGSFEMWILRGSGDSVVEVSYANEPLTSESVSQLETSGGDWLIEHDLDGDGQQDSTGVPQSIVAAERIDSLFQIQTVSVSSIDSMSADVAWTASGASIIYQGGDVAGAVNVAGGGALELFSD
jgi:hypothetical protein